jgi:hypothetical protein
MYEDIEDLPKVDYLSFWLIDRDIVVPLMVIRVSCQDQDNVFDVVSWTEGKISPGDPAIDTKTAHYPGPARLVLGLEKHAKHQAIPLAVQEKSIPVYIAAKYYKSRVSHRIP